MINYPELVCPHCGELAPYGDERLVWISVHLESRLHRWWWELKRVPKWDWVVLSLYIPLIIIALHVGWWVLIFSWVILGIAEAGDYVKRRRRRTY